MMKCKLKSIIIILSMFLLVSIVYGAEDVECQISQNNLTWNSTNTTLFDTNQDDTNGIMSIQNLVADTEYYIRCKNSTTEWGYDTFTTAEAGGGFDEMELAIILLLISLIGLGAFITYKMNGYTRVPVLLGTLILCLVALNVVANLAEAAGVSATVVSLLWFIYEISLYIFIFLVFVGLIILLTYLQIKPTKQPMIKSPMWHAKNERKKRTGKKDWQ